MRLRAKRAGKFWENFPVKCITVLGRTIGAAYCLRGSNNLLRRHFTQNGQQKLSKVTCVDPKKCRPGRPAPAPPRYATVLEHYYKAVFEKIQLFKILVILRYIYLGLLITLFLFGQFHNN